MNIDNTIPVFISFYKTIKQFSLDDLKKFLNDNDAVYQAYFPNHCPRTDERLQQAVDQYGNKIREIEAFSKQFPEILQAIERRFQTTYDFDVPLHAKLIVGTFGSNAFVTSDNKRELYFAAEKLSAKPDHMRVIAAHEIGHVNHFSMATKGGMDWSKVDWMHGLTTLYTEGAATYFSKQIVPDLKQSMYFSFDDEGDPWVQCYEENKEEVKRRFLQDASAGWDMPKEKEWFRLSGGSYFGRNRIGYLLGTDYIENLVERFGEKKALTFWNGNDLHADAIEWLKA
ncbi:aminopeptidase [Sporosarcina contaminans]|uniref:Aminopeptidase n=1 Tax=Sporosarcina contaminans TaxID=633403 RepID=A0ABW3TZ11_9BACL